MKDKNAFLKTFIALPEKKIINQFLWGSFLLDIVFIPITFYWYYAIFLRTKDHNNLSAIILTFIIISFIVFLIVKILTRKKPTICFLYTSSCFTIFSLYMSYVACKVIYKQFDDPLNIILIIVAVILYLFILFLTFLNIYNKFKTNYSSTHKVDPKVTKSLITLCVILGMLASKKLEFNLSKWFLLLMLSYCTVPAYGGFYQYYLSSKLQKEPSV